MSFDSSALRSDYSGSIEDDDEHEDDLVAATPRCDLRGQSVEPTTDRALPPGVVRAVCKSHTAPESFSRTAP